MQLLVAEIYIKSMKLPRATAKIEHVLTTLKKKCCFQNLTIIAEATRLRAIIFLNENRFNECVLEIDEAKKLY
jgi:hypothetical protein